MGEMRKGPTLGSVGRRRGGKGRGVGAALRQALARRRLEELREARHLQECLYDVFKDDVH